MPKARCNPVPLSPICAPVTSGGPSSKPVVEAEPPAHCATVQLLDPLPGEPHTIERARSEVLHQHVTALHEALQDLLALGVLGVEGDGALVVVQHGEVETVDVRDVAQLLAGDVPGAGPLHLDDVCAQPGEQLRAGGPRLNVREVENTYAVQCL